MSNLSKFLKQNKIIRENVKLKVTKSLLDETGEPLEWELRPLTAQESESIREMCTKEVPVRGKKNQYTEKVDAAMYLSKLICASIVEPNLNDKELQDSYGVLTPEDLIVQMVDDPGEYNDLGIYVLKFNNLTKTLDDEVETAKN